MTEKSHVQEKALWLNSLLKCRMNVLIVGVLGGGTMIAFPVASAAVLIYIALALGTIGMMAWIGVMALAPVGAAALIVSALIIITVLLAVAGVRCLVRMGLPPSDVDDRNKQQVSVGGTGCDERAGLLQKGLDDWEVDGGPAAPARRRVVRRRVRRSHRRRRRAGPNVGTSEGDRVLTIQGDHHAKPR